MPRIRLSTDSDPDAVAAFLEALENLRRGRLYFDESAPTQPPQADRKTRDGLRPLVQALERPATARERVQAIEDLALAIAGAYGQGTPLNHAAQVALDVLRAYPDPEHALVEVLELSLRNALLADVGIRPLSGGVKGGQRPDSRKARDVVDRKQRVYAAFGELAERRPDLSLERLYDLVSRETGISRRSVKRYMLER